MDVRAESAERDRAVPRLAADCDPTRLELTPAEAYLLSRVDGRTPWSQLRQIGGLPVGEVDRCLVDWLDRGVLLLDGETRKPEEAEASAAEPRAPEADAQPEAEGEPETPEAAAAPSLAIDPALQIDEDDQRRIVEFEGKLALSYYGILGVPRDADAKTIKRAYFKLSKEFHPDRYFRRDIGAYRELLDRIFKKIVEAYELLSDPATRAEVDRELSSEAGAASGARRRKRIPRPFGVMSKMIRARKLKAKRFYEAGMAAFHGQRWLEASGSVRLAIAFDPQNQAYKEGFVDVVQRANEIRSAQVLIEAQNALDDRCPDEALALYEEALHLRPHDPQINHTAARLSLIDGKDLRKAKEYAASACEMEPDDASHHLLLGQIYKAANLAANARRELETALRLDPKNREAKSELKGLKRR